MLNTLQVWANFTSTELCSISVQARNWATHKSRWDPTHVGHADLYSESFVCINAIQFTTATRRGGGLLTAPHTEWCMLERCPLRKFLCNSEFCHWSLYVCYKWWCTLARVFELCVASCITVTSSLWRLAGKCYQLHMKTGFWTPRARAWSKTSKMHLFLVHPKMVY